MNTVSRYNQLENLKNSIGLDNIKYVGSIELFETDPYTNAKIKTITDVFIDKPDKNNLLKFYDSNGNVIAAYDGMNIAPSQKYSKFFNNTKNVLGENSKGENIDTLFILREYATREGISLDSAAKKLDKELDEIADALGISKDKINSITSIEDLDENDILKNKNEKQKIRLNDKEKNKSKQKDIKEEEKKEDPLKDVTVKQKACLSQKIDAYHTLGSLLGVPSNGELVVVNSTDIQNNENHTRFSFLIKDSNGNLSKPKNLEQIAGNRSSMSLAASDRTGDNVIDKGAYSTYAIKGSNGMEYVLTTNIGQHGVIELGFGQIDKTQGVNSRDSKAITVPIETNNTYYRTTTEVKKDLVNPYDGTRQAAERSAEYQKHEDAKCQNITSKDSDGKDITGHTHDNENMENKNDLASTIDMMIERIYESNPDMKSYSKNELSKSIMNNKERFNIDLSKQGEIERLEEIVKDDYEAIDRTPNRNHRPY